MLQLQKLHCETVSLPKSFNDVLYKKGDVHFDRTDVFF